MGSVILIGFMGAGKTTVGRAYAKSMGIPFADTDDLIEKEAGMTVSEIFESRGEGEFRKMETAVLCRLRTDKGEKVISTGGGLALREENQKLLRDIGRVAFLSVRPETVLKRLEGDASRPLLRGGDVKERIENLLLLRDPIYQKVADLSLRVDDRQVDEIAKELAERLGELK